MRKLQEEHPGSKDDEVHRQRWLRQALDHLYEELPTGKATVVAVPPHFAGEINGKATAVLDRWAERHPDVLLIYAGPSRTHRREGTISSITKQTVTQRQDWAAQCSTRNNAARE